MSTKSIILALRRIPPTLLSVTNKREKSLGIYYDNEQIRAMQGHSVGKIFKQNNQPFQRVKCNKIDPFTPPLHRANFFGEWMILLSGHCPSSPSSHPTARRPCPRRSRDLFKRKNGTIFWWFPFDGALDIYFFFYLVVEFINVGVTFGGVWKVLYPALDQTLWLWVTYWTLIVIQ